MRVKTGNIAAAFGKGIFAGVAGTAVMTISSTVEMKLQERPGENRLSTAHVGLASSDESSSFCKLRSSASRPSRASATRGGGGSHLPGVRPEQVA